jgi:hypothetical protein
MTFKARIAWFVIMLVLLLPFANIGSYIVVAAFIGGSAATGVWSKTRPELITYAIREGTPAERLPSAEGCWTVNQFAAIIGLGVGTF